MTKPLFLKYGKFAGKSTITVSTTTGCMGGTRMGHMGGTGLGCWDVTELGQWGDTELGRVTLSWGIWGSPVSLLLFQLSSCPTAHQALRDGEGSESH